MDGDALLGDEHERICALQSSASPHELSLFSDVVCVRLLCNCQARREEGRLTTTTTTTAAAVAIVKRD